MRTIPTSLARPRAVRRHLADALAVAGRGVTLTRAGAIVATLSGYADWAELKRSAGRDAPSPRDGELDDAARDARLAFQAARLAVATGLPGDEAAALVAALRVSAHPSRPVVGVEPRGRLPDGRRLGTEPLGDEFGSRSHVLVVGGAYPWFPWMATLGLDRVFDDPMPEIYPPRPALGEPREASGARL